jgi:hypothetical protein
MHGVLNYQNDMANSIWNLGRKAASRVVAEARRVARGLARRLRAQPLRVARSEGARLAMFWLLCAAYSLGRHRVRAVSRSEHRMSRWRFLTLATQQLREEGLRHVAFGHGPLVSLPYLIDALGRDPGRARAGFRARAGLFLADGLKAEGFYADAEHLYRRIARKHHGVADVALTGLADLIFLQAQWASEFHAYAADNIALNPLARLPADPRRATWHERKFTDAVAVLDEALAHNPQNRDALWLMANIFELQDRWGDGLKVARRYADVAGRTREIIYHEARSIFALNADEGERVYGEAAGGAWRTAVRQFASSEDLRDEGRLLRDVPCEAACELRIKTHVVTRGEQFDIDHAVQFAPRRLYEYADAEILPRFGMIAVDGQWLLTDTAHVKRLHWPVFTRGLAAVTQDRALLCTAHPIDAPCEEAIYIGNNNNYFHWIVEELPRLKPILADPRYRKTAVLIPHDAAAWQLDLIARLGIGRDRWVFTDFSVPVRLARLISPPRLAKDLVVHPAAVRFLRETFVPNEAALKPRAGKRLYLARDAQGRALLNESEVMARFVAAGFRVVNPGVMTLDAQMELFSDAEVIAGPGGAALTNILFAPRDAKIIALASDDVLTETFSSMAAALGQEYWLCTGPAFARAHRYWIWTRYNFILDLDDVDACLASLETALTRSRIAAFQAAGPVSARAAA